MVFSIGFTVCADYGILQEHLSLQSRSSHRASQANVMNKRPAELSGISLTQLTPTMLGRLTRTCLPSSTS